MPPNLWSQVLISSFCKNPATISFFFFSFCADWIIHFSVQWLKEKNWKTKSFVLNWNCIFSPQFFLTKEQRVLFRLNKMFWMLVQNNISEIVLFQQFFFRFFPDGTVHQIRLKFMNSFGAPKIHFTILHKDFSQL